MRSAALTAAGLCACDSEEWEGRFPIGRGLTTRPTIGRRRAGVTLLEMLIVVTIIATIVSVSFPALTAGLAGIRLKSASGSAASFLTSAMNNVERREQPAAILVDPTQNILAVYTAESNEKPRDTMKMPQGISIEGDVPRRFVLFPGGAFPRIAITLKNEKGARKSIEIDPITAVPQIK